MQYEIDPNFDFTFDEKGNTFLALRKVSWNGRESKLDLRKWYMNANGEETVGKGTSFLTEDGPNELTKILLDNGFCDTEVAINSLKERPDFMSSLNKSLNMTEEELKTKLSNIEEDYYNPITLMEE